MAADYLGDPAAAQDALRPFRNFVALLSGATSDQTWGYTDAYAVNTAGQFPTPQSVNGTAVEGKPMIIGAGTGAQPAGLPMWAWLALGAGAAWLVARG